MNRHILSWRARTVWSLLLLVPALALAQSPYQGIYFGTFQGTADDGEFALIVNDRGHGTLVVYDAVDDTGYIENNVYIRADGSFQFVTRRRAFIHGQVTDSDVSGQYIATGSDGSFSGWREAGEGPFQDVAGYYSGPASIVGAEPWNDLVVNSRLVAIVAADGSAFFLLDRARPLLPWLWPGDFDFGYDFDFEIDLGFGFDLDLGFNSGSPFYGGFGSCRPFHFRRGFGWPFNAGLDYSFRMSFLGFLGFDLDFDFNLPACTGYPAWNPLPAPVFSSGGFVQIEPDGGIQGSLLDGLVLMGRLDPLTARAEGIMSQQQDSESWTGHWEIERRDNSGTNGEEALIAGLTEQSAHRELAGVGDFDGDGAADILWRDYDAGLAIVTLTSAGADAREIQLDAYLGPEWQLGSVGDLDGDGTDDLIWRDHWMGENIAWRIVEAQVAATTSLKALPELNATLQP